MSVGAVQFRITDVWPPFRVVDGVAGFPGVDNVSGIKAPFPASEYTE